MAISSSLALRASLERLAASLFFRRLSQYASSFWLSGSVRGRFRLPPEEMELVEDTKGGAVGVGKGEEMGGGAGHVAVAVAVAQGGRGRLRQGCGVRGGVVGWRGEVGGGRRRHRRGERGWWWGLVSVAAADTAAAPAGGGGGGRGREGVRQAAAVESGRGRGGGGRGRGGGGGGGGGGRGAGHHLAQAHHLLLALLEELQLLFVDGHDFVLADGEPLQARLVHVGEGVDAREAQVAQGHLQGLLGVGLEGPLHLAAVASLHFARVAQEGGHAAQRAHHAAVLGPAWPPRPPASCRRRCPPPSCPAPPGRRWGASGTPRPHPRARKTCPRRSWAGGDPARLGTRSGRGWRPGTGPRGAG